MTSNSFSPDVKDRIKSFAERMDHVLDGIDGCKTDIKALREDLKEIKAEAKGTGFDVKTLYAGVVERRKRRADIDDYDEAKAMWDIYFKILMSGEPRTGLSKQGEEE